MATKKIAKNAAATTPEIADAESISQIVITRPVVIENLRYYVKEIPALWAFEYHKLEEGEEKTNKLVKILMYCVTKRGGEALFTDPNHIHILPMSVFNGLVRAVLDIGEDNNGEDDGSKDGSKVTDPKELNPIPTSDLPTD
jgi:hypothetical protein